MAIFSAANATLANNLSIWPVYHDYALKELSFNVVENNVFLGDVNADGTINVIDIVAIVNYILP